MALFAGIGSISRAYETDQLTHRDVPLADAAAWANARVDASLADAIAATNRHTKCKGAPARMHLALAKQIFRRTAPAKAVWGRGPFRMWGHGRYSSSLETSPDVQRFDFADREDIYGGLSLRESVILHLAGPASTVQINGVRLGTDKLHHFFGEGYRYFRKSHEGAVPTLALEWGTRTERLYFGLLTSRTFSFADLRANRDGYDFYEGLLGKDSVVQRGDDGCLEQTRPWDWGQYVDWQYDELLNPSVYAPIAQWGVRRRLEETRDQVCEAYGRWQDDATFTRMSISVKTTPTYLYGPYPTRGDPFQLEALCAVLDAGPPPPIEAPQMEGEGNPWGQ